LSYLIHWGFIPYGQELHQRIRGREEQHAEDCRGYEYSLDPNAPADEAPREWYVGQSERIKYYNNADLFLGKNDKDWHHPILITIRQNNEKNHRKRSATSHAKRDDRRRKYLLEKGTMVKDKWHRDEQWYGHSRAQSRTSGWDSWRPSTWTAGAAAASTALQGADATEVAVTVRTSGATGWEDMMSIIFCLFAAIGFLTVLIAIMLMFKRMINLLYKATVKEPTDVHDFSSKIKELTQDASVNQVYITAKSTCFHTTRSCHYLNGSTSVSVKELCASCSKHQRERIVKLQDFAMVNCSKETKKE
jgi:hypothetical protein